MDSAETWGPLNGRRWLIWILSSICTQHGKVYLFLAARQRLDSFEVSIAAIVESGVNYVITGQDDFLIVVPSRRFVLRELFAGELQRHPEMFHLELTSPHGRYEVHSVASTATVVARPRE